MSDFPVYYFNESLRGAPQVSGTAGALIAVLDACLITGFGSVSVTGITVADGVATCTVNSGDTFAAHHIIEISGASPSELNGRHRVLPGATLTKFAFETDADSGAATGSITAKYAPAEGWAKVFDDDGAGKKAVYRATSGHRFYYRIDDDLGQKYAAEIRGFEQMSDVDTGSGPFPPSAVNSYLGKSSGADATAKRWDLFTDGRFVIFGAQQWGDTSADNKYATPGRGFGEPIALAPNGDDWCSIVCSSGELSNNVGLNVYAPFFISSRASYANRVSYATRPLAGIGNAQYGNNVAESATASDAVSGADAQFGPAPSTADGRIYLSRVLWCESHEGPPRSVIPGVRYAPQTGLRGLFANRDVLIPDAGELVGRRVICLGAVNSSANALATGIWLVDATGPWR